MRPSSKFLPFTASPSAWRAALSAGLLHAAFALLVQVENLGVCCSASFGDWIGHALRLPLLQLENFAAALALMLLVGVTWPLRPRRWFAALLLLAFNLALVVHQAAYATFLGPLRLGFLQEAGSPWFFLGSVRAELGALFYVNLLVAVGLTVGWGRWNAAQPDDRTESRRLFRKPWAGLAVAVIGLSAWTTQYGESMNLQRHPLVALLAEAVRNPIPHAEFVDATDIYANRFDQVEETPEAGRRLQGFAAALAQRQPRPNVVLVVLESSGSRNVLGPDGLPDAAVTPNLRRLAQHAVVFDSLYTNFPGTVHSNLAMMTGGFFTTWQPIKDAIVQPYQGPTLAKAFAANGYATALFASADLGHLNFRDFVGRAGYATFFDFGQLPEAERLSTRLNSWGGRDDAIAARAIDWLAQARRDGKPFFLQFMSNSPHHPYAIPEGFKSSVAVPGKRGEYLRALNYIDAVVGEIVGALDRNGLRENTIIAVTGDHGEAFGYYRPRAKTHMGAVYEENVRNFLLLSVPGSVATPFVSGRVGDEGDIFATLGGLAFHGSPDIAGQNLLAPDYRPHIAFFHFDNRPGAWGLRDGRWKYISPDLGARPEFYDLSRDPDEQVNLAAEHASQIALYERLLASWFVYKNREYMARAAGEDEEAIAVGGLTTPGPKLLDVGYLRGEGRHVAFAATDAINPREHVVALSQWVSFPSDHVFKVVWQAPDGKAWASELSIRPDTRSLRTRLPAPLPLPAGDWSVRLEENGKAWLAHRFKVDSGIALAMPENSPPPRLLEVSVGRYYQGQLLQTSQLQPRERFVIKSEWAPEDHDEPFSYLLISPEQVALPFEFTLAAEADEHMRVLNPPQAMQPGIWRVVVWGRGDIMGETQFKVGGKSNLMGSRTDQAAVADQEQ